MLATYKYMDFVTAYGACLYIRSTDSNNKTSRELVCSTSKVAPLKQLTIPRLELCAATLLSKLYKKAIGALNITISESYLWTDSSIVLTWIQGPPNKWKIFVGNRVALIQEETASASWRHVPSQSNPADLISGGIEPTTLSTSTLWWKGPEWLSQEPSSWPITEIKHNHRQPGNQKCAHCISTNSRRHHTKIFQVEQTFQSNCKLQEIHKQLQKFQGHQAINHSPHTRS